MTAETYGNVEILKYNYACYFDIVSCFGLKCLLSNNNIKSTNLEV